MGIAWLYAVSHKLEYSTSHKTVVKKEASDANILCQNPIIVTDQLCDFWQVT